MAEKKVHDPDIEKKALDWSNRWVEREYKKIDSDERFQENPEEAEKAKKRIDSFADSYYLKVLNLFDKDMDWQYAQDDEVFNRIIKNDGQSYKDFAEQKAENLRKEGYSGILDKWYGMTQPALYAEAEKMGYNMYKPLDRDAFFENLRKYQGQRDRAKIINDFSKTGSGIVARALFPTAYDEAVKQVTTGDYNDAKISRAENLDTVSNHLTLLNPFTKFVPGLIWQTAGEVTRQAGQSGWNLGDEEFNPSEVLVTAGASATTPALKGSLQAAASKFGAEGKGIAEGIESTTKGSPLDLEIERNIRLYDKGGATVNHNALFTMPGDEHIVTKPPIEPVDAASVAAYRAQREAERVYNAFSGRNTTPKEFYKNPNKYTKQSIVEATENGYSKTNQALKEVAPEGYRIAEGASDKYRTVGAKIGKGAEWIGGRLEPTIKANPGEIIGPVMNGNPSLEGLWKSIDNSMDKERLESIARKYRWTHNDFTNAEEEKFKRWENGYITPEEAESKEYDDYKDWKGID